MTSNRARFIEIAGNTVHFLEWGRPQERAVVLWHAFTGRCSDHVELARALAADGHYVIAPDAPGCGLSDWSRAPIEDYCLAGYARAIEGLLGEIGVREADWIGSSVGGFIGVSIAAAKSPIAIRRLVLNEVGLELNKALHEPLRAMLASPPAFESFPGFEAHLRKFLTRGGLVGDEAFFRNLSAAWSRRTDDGRFTSHHDPKISVQFTHSPADFDMREAFRAVSAPTLFLRASIKPIISDEETREIASSAKARIIERPGGHISLMADLQTQGEILQFLKTDQ